MTSESRGPRAPFLRATVLWLVGLVFLGLLFRVTSTPSFGGGWSAWEILVLLPAWIGVLLPAAAFAGGLAGYGAIAPRAMVLRGAVVAVATYLVLAYAHPIADYRWDASVGRDVSVEQPFGPLTPGALAAMRDSVRASPPAPVSFQSGVPFQRPANWWTLRIHETLAVGAFAFLAVLLGYQVARLTGGLSPPKRRNARWAIGVLSMVLFFVAESRSGVWIRSSPENSGVLGGWAPVAVPVIELLLLTAIARRKFPFLHASARSSVI